jgi:hypothetical protein
MRLAIAAFFAALLVVSDAAAFCGFYVSGADTKLFNNATQVVMLRAGTRTVLSMQNNYQGPPEKFAMVVPVPIVLQKENVKTLPKDVFAKIDQLASPRLVEYWEQDPCYEPPPQENMPYPATPSPAFAAAKGGGGLGVKVEAQFTVGEYDIVILSAKDAGGLEEWLRLSKYTIPSGAAESFRPYVQRGSKFFVAKVDIEKVKLENGMATLSPLRFHYDDESFTLPIRLGLINAKDAQDLVVHILAEGTRYEAANYPNVTIPTNLDVSEQARNEFGSFYAALFDKTLEKTPKAVVTEYAWASTSCDPCPGPTLDPSDIQTFGGDVLPDGGRRGASGDYVLTRLHARYTKQTLGEDLVFRVAPPIQGGREMTGADGKLEQGATKTSFNNFQARYAIRHPWTKPITCKSPRRGIWGGPPAGVAQEPVRVPPSKDLALAKRGSVLASFVTSGVPELQVGGAPPASVPSAPVPAKAGRCGCDAPGVPVSSTLLAALAAPLLGWLARRRRR